MRLGTVGHQIGWRAQDSEEFMNEQSRHVPLRSLPWDPAAAAQAIDEIIADALAHFGGERLWPAHPMDDDVADGNSSIYMGAAGMIWALEYLRRLGANKSPFDFQSYLTPLLEKTRAEMQGYGSYSVTGSLLLGDMGTALMIMRLAPSPAIADIVAARANANTELPIRELMWGMAGSMMACLAMGELTGDERWRGIFETQAERLLGDLEDRADGPIWEQDLYGKHLKFLGPVHGYAGNMLPLMRGWDWLTEDQRVRVADAVPRTLSQHAWRGGLGTTWRGTVEQQEPPDLCQYCHGAAGMVTTFADAPFTSPELETLLLDGGRYTWAMGPLAKGSNLCHGTGGNGYAFLKLHRRTGDAVWLERAHAFAMTGIAQCREARVDLGRGRYTLWTGDIGLAIYLWDCLTGVPRFPTVDVF
jgi:Lanthionine synthetase C-like protein